MDKIKTFLYGIIGLLLFVGIEVFAQDLQKIRLNPDQAYGGNFSNYFSDIEYIPLETTKESLFGQISEIMITDSSFIIVDIDTKSVLFFSHSGRFLKKIVQNGSAKVNGAIFDPHSKSVIIGYQKNRIDKLLFERHSILGRFIEKIDMSDVNPDRIQNSIIVNEYNYWLRNSFSKSDTIPSSYFYQYKNNLKINEAVPLDSANSFAIYRLRRELGDGVIPSIYNNFFYFSTPFEHKLYQINALTGQSQPLFQMVFPKKFGIDNFLLTIKDKNKMDSIVKKEWFTDKTILGLENIRYDTKKIIFRAKRGVSSYYGSDGQLITRNFLYRFKDGFLASFERMHPDASTFFLPFYNASTLAFKGFHFQDEYLYTYLSSLELFAAHQANKNKNPNYPLVLQEYFKTQNRKSNPVIVRMKLKD